MHKRVLWLDITKALAIILMVLGHTSIPKAAADFIFAFHMPVFFLASGWCMNWGKYSFGDLLKRRCKTLLLPFIVYSAIVIGLSLLMDEELFSWSKGWQGYALWFVPVLFLSTLLAKLITAIENKTIRAMALIGCIGLGIWLCYSHTSLPWTISTVPYATFLILCGTYLRRWENVITEPKWYIVVVGIAVVATVSHFWRLDLAWNKILPVIPLTLGALSGAAMLATISSYIEKSPKWIANIFLLIGKETFAIMAFSQIVIIALNKFFVMNPIIKYTLLAAILTVIIYAKNLLKKAFNTAK